MFINKNKHQLFKWPLFTALLVVTLLFHCALFFYFKTLNLTPSKSTFFIKPSQDKRNDSHNYSLSTTTAQKLSHILSKQRAQENLNLKKLKTKYSPNQIKTLNINHSSCDFDIGTTLTSYLDVPEMLFDNSLKPQEAFSSSLPANFLDSLKNLEEPSRQTKQVPTYDVEVTYAQKSSEEILFKVLLKSKHPVIVHKEKQHFSFIIDKCSSYDSVFFGYYKHALLNALVHMHPEDTFNVWIVDKKCSKFSNEDLSVNPKTLNKLTTFLNKHRKSHTLKKEYLSKVLSKLEESNHYLQMPHHVFVLSDFIKDKSLSEINSKNSYHCQIDFILPAKYNNQILSNAHYSQHFVQNEHELLPHLISKLNLYKYPMAKNLHLEALSSSKNKIELLPLNLNQIYSDQDLIIYGRTKDLSDFSLFIQGDSIDGPVDLKEEISLAKGLKLTTKELKEDIEKHLNITL